MALTGLETALLGAIAGGTIFLGLPVAKLPVSTRTRNLLNGVAIGILFFLLVEILHGAFEPVEEVFEEAFLEGEALHPGLPIVLVVGLVLGLVGLAWFDDHFVSTQAESRAIAIMIASGIGFHNFSEGLAIGQSAASGAVSLAMLLVVGFALHNITEGFGIAAPLSGSNTSFAFLGGLGLLAGGPTFVGTLIGQLWTSKVASVFFLALAGGALIYVIQALYDIKRPTLTDTVMFGAVAFGMLAGFGTELVVAFGMAS